MKNYNIPKFLRYSILALLTVLVTWGSYEHVTQGGSKAPSIHAICPYGGLESLYQFFTAGDYISKIMSGTMILFFITFVIALLFRKSFCGLICPFGAIQEFTAKLGQLIFRKKLVIPTSIDKPMRYLKYVVLIITVIYAWKTAGLWMAPYDPWSAYGHLAEGLESVWAESAVGLILLVITILGSLLYDRFFCKYLCPMGAFYGILGKISPYRVTRNNDLCINCGKCNNACPMNIDVQHKNEVKTAECINCMSCVLSCPAAGALENKFVKKSVSPLVSIVVVMILFWGSIFAAQSLGIYQIKPNPISSNETISINELKGSMTISEAATATKIDLKEFYTKFSIPDSVPSDTMMKKIVNFVPGFDFHKIKDSLQ